jgi:hypothetical protein
MPRPTGDRGDRRVETATAGYDALMTANQDQPRPQDGGAGDAARDLDAPHSEDPA